MFVDRSENFGNQARGIFPRAVQDNECMQYTGPSNDFNDDAHLFQSMHSPSMFHYRSRLSSSSQPMLFAVGQSDFIEYIHMHIHIFLVLHVF